MKKIVYILLLLLSPLFWKGGEAFSQTTNYSISTQGTKTISCSGTNNFYDSGGSGSSYSNNETYTMTFTAPTGSCVTVSFSAFNVENNFDYLYVFDGSSVGSPLIGQYTGATSPGTFTSSSGSITFKFTSDAGTTASGWAATISCSASCGSPRTTLLMGSYTYSITSCPATYTLYDDGGSLANYTDNKSYTLTIAAPAGSCLSVNFTSFNTENCNCDKLTIYDGNSTGATVVGTYTGTNSPGTVTSTGTAITIKFTSDANTNAAGWAATISCTSGCSGTPTGGTANASVTNGCASYTTALSLTGASSGCGISYQWQSSPDGSTWSNIAGATSSSTTATVSSATYYHCVITCSNGGASATSSNVLADVNCVLMNNTNYTISSCPASVNFYDSGGPGSNYSNNENYTKTITVPAGSCLSINFSSFTVESGCTCDFMYIYDGPSTASPLIGQYSGTSPGTVTSSGTSITIKFTSDGATTKAGWAAIISCISACTGTPTGGTANASVTNGCSSYSTVLSLTGGSSGCGISYQWQSSPDGTTWSNIAGATATSATTTVTGTTYYHCVTTCSNGGASATSSNVQVNINCILISTGGTVTTCSSSFYDDGGSGSNYGNNKNQTITICPSTAGQCIQAVFTSFNTESGYDFVSVYDNNSTSSGYVNTLSGSLGQFTVTASTNNSSGCLTFNFTSDGATTASGWAATITCGACGNPYLPPNTDCSTAWPICSNSSFPGTSNGAGVVHDITAANVGCLNFGDPSTAEHQSSWFTFKSVTTGTIGMSIAPTSASTDYDWAIWGPMNPITCPPPNAPVRCSSGAPHASCSSNSGSITGMSYTATDVSDGDGCTGDQWTKALPVIAGDEYVMMIDNWNETGDSYNISWQLNVADLSCDIIILPIEMVNFVARKREEEVMLEWQTLSEANSDYFYVQRSANGVDFETIASIKGAGNSFKTLSYSAYDKYPLPGRSYYRIKTTDFVGGAKYTPLASVEFGGQKTFLTYIRPNPTNSNVDFDFYSSVNGTVHTEIIDNMGRIVYVSEQPVNSGKTTLSAIMENLSPGVYSLNVSFDNGSFNSVHKIVKQ